MTKSSELRVPQDHALIGKAKSIPIPSATPVFSISPVMFPVPGRIVDLQVRVSAPTIGSGLPIILLSHGHGRSNHLSSMNGYGPLANFWAAHGFVVIQPTHLSSKSLNFDSSVPGAPLFWRSRVEDMKHIIDNLNLIENSIPGLQGRLDRSAIAVAGHSMGGHTAGILLGARLKDPEDGQIVNLIEPRIKAGILIAAPGNGNGGADLSDFARESRDFDVFRDPSFAEMTTPTLVVAGDADSSSFMTIRGPSWHVDPYTFSPGPKSLLTLFGGEHGLGGVSGYDAGETTDENIERVAVVQRLTWAYLRSVLYPEDKAWSEACAALQNLAEIGQAESK